VRVDGGEQCPLDPAAHERHSGTGSSTIRLDVQPNADAARSGTATIAGHVVTVNQDTGCLVSLNPSSQVATVGSGAGSVAVSAGAGCTWTAISGAAWIAVTSGANGSGSGTVQFTFEANVTGMPRSGTITIGGQQFTINQAGS
jgi:Viral BACON domain/Putative binding domain, N-terminal